MANLTDATQLELPNPNVVTLVILAIVEEVAEPFTSHFKITSAISRFMCYLCCIICFLDLLI